MGFSKWLSIRIQLLILAISTGIIVISIILIIYIQVVNVIDKNNSEYMNDMTIKVKQSISNNCDLMDRILTSIAYSSIVQDYLMETDPNRKYDLFRGVDTTLINMQQIKSGIIDFILIGENGNSYFLQGQKPDVKKIIKEAPKNIISYYTKVNTLEYNNTTHDCFLLISTVYSINMQKRSGEKIGMAAIVFDADVLGVNNEIKALNSAIRFYLIDRNGVVYSNNSLTRYGNIVDVFKDFDSYILGRNIVNIGGRKLVIDKNKIPEIGGKIICSIPENEMYRDLFWIRRLVIVILLIFGVLLFILFSKIIYNILYPLKKFMDFIILIREGNLKGLKKRINLSGYAEIGIMAGEFNSLLDEIDNLTHRLVSTTSRLYETELKKTHSELSYLRSQINPHFLYNTLECLRGMAVDEGALKTTGMAKALGNIFHYNVKGDDIVIIKEELDIIKSYVQIQQIRFDGRFDVEFDFNEDILEFTIPKMTLQPIIENAVCHGLEGKLEKGYLSISGELCGIDCLKIRVMDNGMGIDSVTLEAIRTRLCMEERLLNSENDYSAGIGLLNTHRRIQLIYGTEFGIGIDSVSGEGTNVTMTIPAQKKKV